MIRKVEMYSVVCDNCETVAGEDSGIEAWSDENSALDMAINYNKDFIEHEGKHYCSECWYYDDDDNIIINLERKPNHTF